MEVYGTETSLPILEEASANFFDGMSNRFGRTLDIDNTFGGLGKHIFRSNHASSGRVLNSLDLEATTTNDATHEIVRDKETYGRSR